MGRRAAVRMRAFRREEKAATRLQCSFRGLLGRFKSKQKRLLKFSQSIAEVVPQRMTRADRDERRRGPAKLMHQADQVESDLKVRAIWLEVDSEDKHTDTSHYFFLRGKPLAALQYLEKSLASDRIQGTRLALVAAFTNYATLMSKIGQHAHSKRLVVYALRLLQHYVSDQGTLIKGRVVNEKIGLDGETSDPRFISIRSSAAVVLHNVAVEQLILAEIPNFGESLGRAGEALLAAQNSLGPHHPWRQQVENTHHVILALCKKGKRLDMSRPLKTQVQPISNKQNAQSTRSSKHNKSPAATLSPQGAERSPGGSSARDAEDEVCAITSSSSSTLPAPIFPPG